VTLIDAWGPGNSRSSSGGETRIIRGTYGPNQPYTDMAVRALELWKEHEQRWSTQMFHRIGVLWMAASGNDDFERGSLTSLREAGVAFQELSAGEMAKRWPQINFDGVHWGIYEPESGFLRARAACQTVVNGFIREGGTFRVAAVQSEPLENRFGDSLKVSDGSRLAADKYIFACGPWLGKLFPETVGSKVTATRQEVFFFGTPAGDERFSESALPVLGDNRERFWYGIPATDGRGFKIADDTRGPVFDPNCGDRTITTEALERARDYVSFRFPGMENAPLIESRVCQYENTPDNDFITDRHPGANNIWIVGGGSGHGFKHGPAVGEMVADLVLQEKDPLPRFRLNRFKNSC